MFRWLRRNPPPPVTPDESGYRLPSSLWVDRPDAMSHLAGMRSRGDVDSHEADLIEQFIVRGFAVLELNPDPDTFDSIERDVNSLWADRPWNVAYAYDGPAYPMAYADESRERRPRSRIHDIHSASEAARSLYLDPKLFKFVRLILGEEPVAFQSLYFQFGSQQVIHRDPVVVPTAAPGHLVAAWIALEDIRKGSGELLYVPGSHRLPYYEFSPGEWQFDAYRMGAKEIEEAKAWDRDQCARLGLETIGFTPRRGQALVWHASLMHGGGPVEGEGRTRRSFVVHYSTRATYTTRAITVHERTMNEAGDTVEIPRVVGTTETIEQNGCVGLENPMKTFEPAGGGTSGIP